MFVFWAGTWWASDHTRASDDGHAQPIFGHVQPHARATAPRAWTSLKIEAAATLRQYDKGAPKQRLPDVAAKYANALWLLGQTKQLYDYSAQWIKWDPANGLAFEYLSKAAQSLGDIRKALRAATSIAEISPRNSEQLLRGAWIALALEVPGAKAWARSFAEASLRERTDNPNTYRALALAAWQDGDLEAAAQAYARGVGQHFHPRYGDVRRVISEEAALFIRGIRATHGIAVARNLQHGALRGIDSTLGASISLRITLSWLTDANDVDLHVVDPLGEECYYQNKGPTRGGLKLYSDQTQGLGPEVVVMNAGGSAGVFQVGVKYYSAGAMGSSRGTVVIWQLKDGVPTAPPRLEVFTLPTGYQTVLPVAEFVVPVTEGTFDVKLI